MALLPLILLCMGRFGQTEATLPPGVRAEWGIAGAWREATPTREQICLNGLWRWQPGTDSLPTGNWGWFKVPGPWPGITDYQEKDCQTVYRHPSWQNESLGRLTSAWYEREFTVPGNWKDRRISISASYVNSLASIFIDGRAVGAISFPAGEVDLTQYVKPGGRYRLSIQAVALPLKAVMLSYSDTNAAKQQRATVERRGLCGDVMLVSTPRTARIDDVQIQTSVRKWSLSLDVKGSGLDPAQRYILLAKVLDHGAVVKTFSVQESPASGELRTATEWKPAKLWDIDTPENQYELVVTLTDRRGKILDVLPPKRFGFRELWIDKRDFILNGTRIWWSCVPVDNAAISAGLASYSWARETFKRLKGIGVNMVYTHNYECKPGSNLAFEEILRAADDSGVLVALTQPHFADYEWSAPNADQVNGYARHAAFFAQVAGCHPSVVAYSTSHNATGYNEDTDPYEIDGIHGDRDGWAQNNMAKALRAQAIIERLDPSRIVYHHSSGNLGTMHTMNFYLNFVPMQELDDWYEHWATTGVKPAFMVEYGVPFSWDWSMYRGYYKGQRSFGNSQSPWEYTMAEWNAQFLGDRAFDISEAEKRNIRWEAQKFRSGGEWFRWDYPYPMGSTHPDFEMQQQVWAQYTTDNWRAFRTWGVSGISPWETRGVFWRLKDGVNRGRVDLKTDWYHLQKPGYSADYEDGRYEQRDTSYEANDWVPTTGGKSLIPNNGPLLAYIAGKPEAFTDKTHIVRVGEVVRKQLIVINNSRRTVTCNCLVSVSSSLSLLKPTAGAMKFDLPTGQIRKLPLEFDIAEGSNMRPEVKTTVKYSNGETQTDSFTLVVAPTMGDVKSTGGVGIYDPKGETSRVLASLGVTGRTINPNEGLDGVQTLIIGKEALTMDGSGLDLSGVRSGLKVLVFEQTADVLEKRFGFRVEEYGLRNVFHRVRLHPVLDGLGDESLRDWRGAATLYPPQGTFTRGQPFFNAPSVVRTGILQPRVWRCGNRGSVASVLIEKPTIGDFTPILDGGYSLQYSPLMEYREGKGMVVFCQMDVSGRTEVEPAAQRLVANLLNYAAGWKPMPERTLIYGGDRAGKLHLQSDGYDVAEFNGEVSADRVLVVGPGVSPGAESDAIIRSVSTASNPRTVCVAPSSEELKRLTGAESSASNGGYINSKLGLFEPGSPLAGISMADVFNRDPRTVQTLKPGGGVLAALGNRFVIFELAPWTFDPNVLNTKRVFRRTSFALSRILGNFGVHARTPLLDRFKTPAGSGEERWLKGFYLDKPVLEDDPYRFFGW